MQKVMVRLAWVWKRICLDWQGLGVCQCSQGQRAEVCQQLMQVHFCQMLVGRAPQGLFWTALLPDLKVQLALMEAGCLLDVG